MEQKFARDSPKVETFIRTLYPEVFNILYNPHDDKCKSIFNTLSTIWPDLIIPPLLDRLQSASESLTELWMLSWITFSNVLTQESHFCFLGNLVVEDWKKSNSGSPETNVVTCVAKSLYPKCPYKVKRPLIVYQMVSKIRVW